MPESKQGVLALRSVSRPTFCNLRTAPCFACQVESSVSSGDPNTMRSQTHNFPSSLITTALTVPYLSKLLAIRVSDQYSFPAGEGPGSQRRAISSAAGAAIGNAASGGRAKRSCEGGGRGVTSLTGVALEREFEWSSPSGERVDEVRLTSRMATSWEALSGCSEAAMS